VESQLTSVGTVTLPGGATTLSPIEQALRIINRYFGTAPIYKASCTNYACPGGLPVPRDVEIAPPIATYPLGTSCAGGTGICGPAGVGVDPATNRVYVANQGSGTLTVIDANTNTVLTTISGFGGVNEAVGVAVNPNTNRVYVAGYFSNNVTVIDGSTNNILARIPVGTTPINVAVNPTTKLAYVSNLGANSVSVINMTSNTVLATIPSVGTSPNGIAVNTSTNRVYVANGGSNNVTVINGSTNSILLPRIPVGTNPVGVSVNPNTKLVYVSNNGGSVSVINATSNTVLATIPICGPCASQTYGSGLGYVVVNPTTDRVYVANMGGNNVTVIDGTSNSVLSTFTVGAVPRNLDVNPVNGLVYVSNWVENSVSVVGQREEIREACLSASANCLVVSSTGTLFPGTTQATAVSLVAVSLYSNTTKTGTQMALTVVCDYDTTNSTRQCSAFYVEGNVWSPGQTNLSTSPFIIQNAEPYFYLQFHWWDFQNSRIATWGTWWYGTASNPNWYWGMYWWWRTCVNYYIGIPYIPWWWWSWSWMYWRYWAYWGTSFQT
jgi:YVTN family beta-propeller protein